jgi:LuxR family transcriptional regulator, maltose regulon positive regulatory protein
MFNGLISTKFHNPLTVGHLTVRPRLDARLEESQLAGCRLVLITAPAGFGKSTLVSAWISKQENPFSWISLDSNDNEPRLFLSYLVGALQKINPALGLSQVQRIQMADSADSEAVYADVMASLVNEIATLPISFYLVLDDCHQIKNPSLLRLLAFLIERQPPQMRLILLSREDLPLPVSRLRVRRQVIEIRQSDLQFTSPEAEDFLCNGMGITRLTAQDILALEHSTEGWIAGLQLAALSLKYDPDPSHFIQSFTGSDRYILDYLLDEVFTHQPLDIQNFLLSTSVLDRFCAPLCDTVLQEYENQSELSAGRSQTMLEQVEHSNLFLIPLDNHREWFRYHHLFADLLRHALAQTAAKKTPKLHLRASQWLEANGYIHEAVKHAFLVQDWLYTSELVERHAWNVILHSQVATVSEWCSHFPENIIRKRPALCIFHSWALIIAFKKSDFPAANARLEQAEASLVEIDPETRSQLVMGAPPVLLHPWVTGQITLLRSFILMAAPRKQANPQALIDFGQLSYDQLPADDIPARSASLLDICYASQARCDAEDAERKFEHVVGVALRGGNYFGAVVSEYHRAHGLFSQGRLRDVISFCLQKKQTYAGYFEKPLQDLPAIALLDQAMGCALLELNELAEAERFLRSGLEVGQWMPREELPGYLALARLCAVKGDTPDMAEVLRRLDMRWPDITYCTRAIREVYNLISHPDDSETRKAAAIWAEENPPEIGPGLVVPGIGPAWNDEADYAVYTAWAQIQIILGRTVEALLVLQPMLDVALEHNLNHRVIELSLLQAQAYYVQAQKERVWKPLRLALSHAENEGYLRLVDQGPILIRLLSEAAQRGVAPDYIQRNMESIQPRQNETQTVVDFPTTQQTILSRPISDGLLEPLSSREIEVLTLMGNGLSNIEIAARLYLSPNTMKSHTQNIYGKLEVHSRLQAVNKARELKLI